MLELQKRRKRAFAIRLGIFIAGIIAFWIAIHIAIEYFFTGSMYLKFLLLCILGFGFLGITYLLRTP